MEKGKYRKSMTYTKLEKKLDEVNHIMELIRTVIPIMVLIMQTVIMIKIF